MKQSARILTYVSVLHSLVDFLCAFAVFSRYALTGPAALVYLYYNFAAFALQMPLGILDRQFGPYDVRAKAEYMQEPYRKALKDMYAGLEEMCQGHGCSFANL
ncbi:MAG: hypothetical protein IKF35_01035, partial [Solobacterium sp.]|nr:hypothetical protein [Solobacterium sp.]